MPDLSFDVTFPVFGFVGMVVLGVTLLIAGVYWIAKFVVSILTGG